MISYKHSKKILKNSKIILKDELVKSSKCINRIAADNVFSKTNNPSGNNAAFDGFAINSKDTKNLNKKKGKLFKIIGIVAAGDKPIKKKIKNFKLLKL